MRLQLALDEKSLVAALEILDAIGNEVDIIECGTVLLMSEGLRAIAEIKNRFPEKPVLADTRIARAGSLFSKLACEAGANAVTAVAEAPDDVLHECRSATLAESAKFEIELNHSATFEEIRRTLLFSPDSIIVHHKNGIDFRHDGWIRSALNFLSEEREKSRVGISLAGGMGPEQLRDLDKKWGISTVVVGSSITASSNPARALELCKLELVRLEGESIAV